MEEPNKDFIQPASLSLSPSKQNMWEAGKIKWNMEFPALCGFYCSRFTMRIVPLIFSPQNKQYAFK